MRLPARFPGLCYATPSLQSNVGFVEILPQVVFGLPVRRTFERFFPHAGVDLLVLRPMFLPPPPGTTLPFQRKEVRTREVAFGIRLPFFPTFVSSDGKIAPGFSATKALLFTQGFGFFSPRASIVSNLACRLFGGNCPHPFFFFAFPSPPFSSVSPPAYPPRSARRRACGPLRRCLFFGKPCSRELKAPPRPSLFVTCRVSVLPPSLVTWYRSRGSRCSSKAGWFLVFGVYVGVHLYLGFSGWTPAGPPAFFHVLWLVDFRFAVVAGPWHFSRPVWDIRRRFFFFTPLCPR